MRKALMLFTAAVLLAGSVDAAPALVGLYVDDGHSICRQDVVPYAPFTGWVWVQPGETGMICAEFMVTPPPWVLTIGTLQNGVISVALGDPITGASACFMSCQTEWTWIYQLTFLPTAAMQDYINIMPHPDVGAIQIANCEPGYPIEPLIVLNNLGLNQDCEEAIGTTNSSWGAIKSIAGE